MTSWTAVIVGAALFVPAAAPVPPPGIALAVIDAAASAAGAAARPTLTLGSRGPAVTTAQERLRRLKASVSVDGRFGPTTRRAVQAFQTARGLPADGIVGARTWQALDGGTPTRMVPIVAIRPDSWPTIGARSYAVRPRDTLASIAAATRSTTAALSAANRLLSGSAPTVGAAILVPGSWRCPVPRAGFINDYGFPRVGHLHEGNDMFAPRGTPILAPVSGRAERKEGGLGGYAVQLYADDGNRYYFAHLDRFGAEGQVAAGTVIGYVGNSGDAITTPTHLHLEIHPGGGDPVNPFPTITLACRR